MVHLIGYLEINFYILFKYISIFSYMIRLLPFIFMLENSYLNNSNYL